LRFYYDSFGEKPLKNIVLLIVEIFRLLFKSEQNLILENLMLRPGEAEAIHGAAKAAGII